MPHSKDKQKEWLRNVVRYISDENTYEPNERPESFAEQARTIKESAGELLNN